MSAPRVLDYDSLWQWLEAAQEDANDMAREYRDQGDELEAAEHSAACSAYLEVQRHIEFELSHVGV